MRIAVGTALSAGHGRTPATTTSDLLSAIDRERDLPPHVLTTARALQALATDDFRTSTDESRLRRALLAGYPDRVARRRAPGSPRVLLSSGHGATIGPESGVRQEEFLLALDVTSGRRGEIAEARIRMASAIDAAWLQATRTVVEHHFDRDTGAVRAISRDYYDALVLNEHPVTADPLEAARILADAYVARPVLEADEQLLRRARFAGVDIDLRALAERAAFGTRALKDVQPASAISGDERRRLDELAPQTIRVPSGREARVEYQVDGSVSAAVKLQELFGLADTPRIGPRREPVLLLLLAPNGRPVQTTRDLRSFWERTYPEVRRELRGRYPRHPWPEDPWTAKPTARTTRRS